MTELPDRPRCLGFYEIRGSGPIPMSLPCRRAATHGAYCCVCARKAENAAYLAQRDIVEIK